MVSKTMTPERFWKKVDKNGPIPEHRPELGPCWLWTGTVASHGYGNVGVNGKITYTHIYARLITYGPHKQGLELDHLCRNRLCCNPDHLDPVTHTENMLRSPIAKVAQSGKCSKGHVIDETAYVIPGTAQRRCRVCLQENNRIRAAKRKKERAIRRAEKRKVA